MWKPYDEWPNKSYFVPALSCTINKRTGEEGASLSPFPTFDSQIRNTIEKLCKSLSVNFILIHKFSSKIIRDAEMQPYSFRLIPRRIKSQAKTRGAIGNKSFNSNRNVVEVVIIKIMLFLHLHPDSGMEFFMSATLPSI